MALPANFDTITVVGSYADFQGNPPPTTPAPGTVDFEPNVSHIKHVGTDLIIFGAKRTATLSAQGTFSVVVPITNDPDVTPSFQYNVTENIPGGGRRQYVIEIPITMLPGPVNLADLIAIGQPPTGTTALTRVVADTLYAPKGSTGGGTGGGSGATETSEATPGSLALRDGSGRIKVGTPTDDAHAAPRVYVLTSISDAVTPLSTLTNELIGTVQGMDSRLDTIESGTHVNTIQLVGNAPVPIGTPPGTLILRRNA